MKVIVQPNGAVEIEVHNGDGQAALDMIRSLQNGHGASDAEPPTPLPPTETRTRKGDPVAALSPGLRATHVALDEYEAAHFSYIAKDLKINLSAANQRLAQLVKRGAARRIGAGVYTTDLSL